MKNRGWCLGLIFTLVLAMAAAVQAAGVENAVKGVAPVKTMTALENYQAAYDGESNAQAKYLAFAKKAQSEGYLKVAALFRALAQAEEMHAAGHAKAIKAMGAKPEAKVVKATVGTTAQNLEKAVKDETYEAETMYPQFAQQAEMENKPDVARGFKGTAAVEGTHAKILGSALADMPAWKASGKIWICTVCGNVVDKLDFQYCPICMAPLNKFNLVK